MNITRKEGRKTIRRDFGVLAKPFFSEEEDLREDNESDTPLYEAEQEVEPTGIGKVENVLPE